MGLWKRKKPELDLMPYVGQWVAIKGGKLIANARDPHGLMAQLEPMGTAGSGCLCFVVPAPAITKEDEA